MCSENSLVVTDNKSDDRTNAAGMVRNRCNLLQGKNTTYVPTVGDESAVDEDVAVVGRRRGSWRRFETPESLVKDELGLPHFEVLLEKLCFVEFDRENILRPAIRRSHRSCDTNLGR